MTKETVYVEGIYGFGSRLLADSVNGLSEDEWFAQPGGTTNHMMFVIGHVVAVRGMVLRMLGQEWSASWEGLFGRGAALVERGQYPSVAEMSAALKDVSVRLSDALKSAPAEVLAREPRPGVPNFDGTNGGVVAFLAFHDAYHVGQAAMLRRWLGHSQVAG